ncbi:MAG TPA: methyltransferase domain-containing protein [Polyangia bacterium]
MGGLACRRCAATYPVFGDVPCLVDDPALWRTIWLRRLDDYTTGAETRVETLRRQAEASHLEPRISARLQRVAAGLAHQVESVAALFEPLDESGGDPLITAAVPGRTDPGEQLAVLEGYETLFRDWSWGEREHALALELLQPLLPEGVGLAAIFGGGAVRLAVEIHQRLQPGRTIALDSNPLPLLAASRLLAGETLTLPEFPSEPRSEDVVVVARDLTGPSLIRPGFTLVLADPLQPPFRAGAVDLVVTPWFLDRARADLRQVAAAVNRVLRPGGLWVNIGPLRFTGELSRAHTIEEVLDIVTAGAFEVTARAEQDLPWLHSPASGARRTELAYAFSARKTADSARIEVPDSLPPWVSNPRAPIPVTPAMIALGRTSMFTTGVLGLIDGTRSVVDVAGELGKVWGIEPARLQDELRAFLARLPG